MSGFASGTQQTIMSDSDKALGWHMHKKPTDKLNAGNGNFFPLTFFPIIFYIVDNSIFIHADNTVVADGDPMGVFSKVVNNGLSAIEGLLAVGNPILFITNVQEFFECITVTVLFTASMKLKLFRFIQGFEFVHVFAAKQL